MKLPIPVRLGIIGDPIQHSLSPVLHNYLLKRLGIEGEYRAYHVRDGELLQFLKTNQGLMGVNVTIPHKESIIQYLDDLDESARRVGAVNTVGARGIASPRFVGYNTDGIGFLRSLAVRDFSPEGRRAIILGAGGAARAVTHALLQSGIAALSVYNRTDRRAHKLAEELRKRYPHRAIFVGHWNDSEALACEKADLLVNTTPVGMEREALPILLPERLSDKLLVYDLVYNSPRARLLVEAEQRGAQTMDGLEMLIYQAIESLKIWLDEPDLEKLIEYDSLKSFLEKRLKEPL
jgi:shikimate dehydrogenase